MLDKPLKTLKIERWAIPPIIPMSNTTAPDLTVREAIALYNALPALDGYVESNTVETTTVEDPKTGQKTTTTKHTASKPVPFKFGVDGKGGGKVRYAIAKNLDILGREEKAFTKTRDALLIDLSGGTGTIDDKDTVLMGKLNVALQEVLDQPANTEKLVKISLNDLNLDENPNLLPSRLGPLMALISE